MSAEKKSGRGRFSVKSGAASVRVSQYKDGRYFFRRKEQGRWKTIVRTQKADIETEAKLTAKIIAEQKSAVLGLPASEIHAFLAWRSEQQKATPLRIALKDYIAAKKTGAISPRYARSLDYLKTILAPLEDGNIRTVTQKDIEGILPKGEGTKARRRNNILADICTFFRWCRKRQILPDGITAPERIDRAAVPPPSKSIFTPDEIEKTFKVIPDEWRAWFAIACFAGLRTEEIQRLDWSDINLARAVIDVRAENAKTKRRRLVPIHPNLSAWLSLSVNPSGLVAPSRIDNFIRTLDGWKMNAPRHSYGSYRLAVIQDAPRLAEEMGNSVAMIRKHYAEAVHPEDGERWFAVMPPAPAKIVRANFRTGTRGK